MPISTHRGKYSKNYDKCYRKHSRRHIFEHLNRVRNFFSAFEISHLKACHNRTGNKCKQVAVFSVIYKRIAAYFEKHDNYCVFVRFILSVFCIFNPFLLLVSFNQCHALYMGGSGEHIAGGDFFGGVAVFCEEF